jgi:hypothetical protein
VWAVSLVEFTEDGHEEVVEREVIGNSHLVRTRCGCGAPAVVAEAYAGPGRCVECRKGDAGIEERVWLAKRVIDPVIGFPVSNRLAPIAVVKAYPAPEVTSRQPWDGAGTPSAVLKQAERAVAASWDVRVQRSRGSVPHATTGRPGAVKTLYALVLGNGGHSAYAVHDGGTWVSVMLWGRTRTWFPHASITDLGVYVDACGVLGSEWYDAIRERESGKIARSKVRAACNRGAHPGMELVAGGMTLCATCGNAWPTNGQPWKMPKKGKQEAL